MNIKISKKKNVFLQSGYEKYFSFFSMNMKSLKEILFMMYIKNIYIFFEGST